MTAIETLQLTDFRCYEQAQLTGLAAGPVVLYGANGAGKTNILEAISLLAPGRGLRGAKVNEMQRRDSDFTARGWAVSAQLQTLYGGIRIGTGRDPATEKRLIRINGEKARGQNALAEYVSCVWLTPQMDRIFIESPGTRRRFLDRLVFVFDPRHAGRITRYDSALAQRSKILKEQGAQADKIWLEALETTMAEAGVAIAAARLDFVQRLQKACDRADGAEAYFFPRAYLAVTGALEELLAQASALEVEELFKYQLCESRQRDSFTGGAATGAHKSDLAVWYAAKDMPADQCSTGEQKALLVGIILAHGRLIAAERGAPPLFLLDEVAAHLDEERRAGLYDLLLALTAQVWLTGTDKSLFAALGARGQYFRVENSRVEPVVCGRAA